jgi:hypothetical protein
VLPLSRDGERVPGFVNYEDDEDAVRRIARAAGLDPLPPSSTEQLSMRALEYGEGGPPRPTLAGPLSPWQVAKMIREESLKAVRWEMQPMMNELDAFLIDVGRMREAQRAYFKTRSRDDLLCAKSYEQTVDRKLQAMIDLVRERR